MEEKSLFTKSQSGFRAKHMTAEQLLRLSENCHLAFKQEQSVASLFLDAEAAPHSTSVGTMASNTS